MSVGKFRDVVEDVVRVRKLLCYNHPWLALLLMKCRVVISEKVPTAGTDGRVLIINPNFWERLNLRQKAFVLLHEVLHIALKHVQGMREKEYHGTWNIACDVVINELLKKWNMFKNDKLSVSYVEIDPVTGIWDANAVAPVIQCDPRDVERMSADEIYLRLLRNRVMERESREFITGRGYGRGRSEVSGEGSSSSADVSEEEEEVPSSSGEEGEEEEVPAPVPGEVTPDDVVQATEYGVSAGFIPADTRVLVNEIAKPKVNWRELLRVELLSFFRSKPISTWVRPSRKLPNDIPGKRFTHGTGEASTIYVLLDVSGSIMYMRRVLVQFLSEVVEIATHFKSRVIVITWDTEVKEVFNLRKGVVSEFVEKVTREGLRGGGGTEPTPVLKYVMSEVEKLGRAGRKGVAVVMLTDGEFYRCDFELMNRVGREVGKAVYCYTLRDHEEIDRVWRRVRVLP
ncbi:MAG: hypothetical protein DRJ40_11630 [Thermoprotei archaeon]|nr:MAG: hypothetical protein DRJ40_11630 [Thermoprotei archaeon]